MRGHKSLYTPSVAISKGKKAVGHDGYRFCPKVTRQLLEFTAIKPHTITLGALIYHNHMSNLFFHRRCIQWALASVFLRSIQDKLHFRGAAIANRSPFFFVAGSLSTSVTFCCKYSHKITSS